MPGCLCLRLLGRRGRVVGGVGFGRIKRDISAVSRILAGDWAVMLRFFRIFLIVMKIFVKLIVKRSYLAPGLS